MKKSRLHLLFAPFGLLFGLLLSYALAALVLGLAPANGGFRQSAQGIDIYLCADAVHTDLILPMRTDARDWHARLPNLTAADYLAIGWGDRAFYLETKTWSDLKPGNALLALWGFDGTLLHIEPMGRPAESGETVRLRISPAQYPRLIAAIDASFAMGADGKPRAIPGAHYGQHDAFYEATGRYSLFTTCNDWVRRVLNQAGIRTATWAPFSQALLYQARAAQ